MDPVPPRIDRRLASAATFANASKEMAPNVQSTGFRTEALRFRTLGDPIHVRLAEDFLINSRLVRHNRESESSIESYFSDSSLAMLSLLDDEKPAGRGEVRLPQSVNLRLELGEAVARRRSVRSYTGDVMRLDYLATILRSSGGITTYAPVDLASGGSVTLRLRATPSGGGLYPIAIYVAVLHVQDLARAIYRYEPTRDTIVRFGDASDVDNLLQSFAVPDEQMSTSRATCIFFLVGRPWRAMRKYGNRGLRFLFIEAGAIAQSIHLVAVALGLASTDCASIYDDEVHEALNVDGLYESLIHVLMVGYPG